MGFHTVLDEQRGLRVHVTKGFRSDWYNINDRVGWVDRNPTDIISQAIGDKSQNLPRYKASVGERYPAAAGRRRDTKQRQAPA
jgi:hypothetical protein